MGASWTDSGGGYSGNAKGTWNSIKRLGPGQFLVQSEVEEVKTTKSGMIIIPETTAAAVKITTTGKIVSGEVPDWLELGDFVLFGKYCGVELTFDDEEDKLYRILEEQHVYCVLDEEAAGSNPEAQKEKPA